MTPPVDDPEMLRRILAHTEALLLDFDGPVCQVFAGIPASVVAEQLRDVLAEGGHIDLPADVARTDDPFDVLFYAAKLGQDEANHVEAAFRAHEVEAVQSATSSRGAHELIRAWTASGRRLAVVSNNSIAAVNTYFDRNDLRSKINVISARLSADVSLLKPSPYLVSHAVGVLAVRPSTCALIGDSATDLEAAHAAGVQAMAYANKVDKVERLAALEPAVIMTDRTYATLAGLVG